MGISGLISVGVGAAMGAWLRWWFGILFNPLFPTLPLGTLAANLLGGYLMGLAMGGFVHFSSLPVETRLFITTGFLGAFTTFSTFSAEAVTLLTRQQYGWAAIHLGSHALGSLVMTGLGLLTVNLARS